MHLIPSSKHSTFVSRSFLFVIQNRIEINDIKYIKTVLNISKISDYDEFVEINHILIGESFYTLDHQVLFNGISVLAISLLWLPGRSEIC